MDRVRWPILYLILGVLVLVATAVTQFMPDNETAQRFGPNMATETLGILLTLLFVQRFLERQDRVRRLRSSLGAFRRGSRALTRLVESWATLIKGVMRTPPRYPPESSLELLEPHHTAGLVELDPQGDAPDGRSWAEWMAEELRTGREALQEVVRVYGASLDAEYVEVLDAYLDDAFFDVFLRVSAEPDSDDWPVRIRQSGAARESHFRRLKAVVELHNELAAEAAEIRDPKRLPQTQGIGVDLPPDYDLRVHHGTDARWWKREPAPGTLRRLPRRAPTA